MTRESATHSDRATLEECTRVLHILQTQFDDLAARVDDLETENAELREENAELRDRVQTVEDETTRLECETDRLETEAMRLERDVDDLQTDAECLETHTNRLERDTARLEGKTTAAINRSRANRDRVAELQARELEKGAHLLADNVDRHELDLESDHVERIRTDGGAYYRLPDADDPLERGGTTLAHADLLPIQQLARMDDEMLRSTTNALPSRLAAKLWKARTDPAVGDDPWQTGCKNVRASVKASDMKHWIRRQEPGTSDSYAKKLVSRTIDALLDLSKNRLAIRRKRERKNGLEYTERRVVLPSDVDVPGESRSSTGGAPETPDVSG